MTGGRAGTFIGFTSYKKWNPSHSVAVMAHDHRHHEGVALSLRMPTPDLNYRTGDDCAGAVIQFQFAGIPAKRRLWSGLA